jgi:hypothetical protein
MSEIYLPKPGANTGANTGGQQGQCGMNPGEFGTLPNLGIGFDEASLMAVFAAIAWGISSIIYYLPVSSSTRATAASIRDHALFAMVLAGTGSAIGKLVEFVLDKAASYAGATKAGPEFMYWFNVNSAVSAGTILAFFAAVLAIGPVIPIIGAFLSYAAAIVYSPATAILGVILITAAMNSVGYFILSNSMKIIFPIGIMLFAAPGRIAKGIGAFLISLAVVSYVALPILPHIIASLLSVTSNGSIDANSLSQVINKLCEKAQNPFSVDTFLKLFTPIDWYRDLYLWLLAVVASAFLLSLIIAAARALSQSLGGVSASLSGG